MKLQLREGFIVLILVLIGDCNGDTKEASVYLSDGKFSIVYGKLDKQAAAYGLFKDDLMQTGWGVLEIKAGYGKHIKDRDLMFAAGMLEGALTAKQIGYHYQNLYKFYFGDPNESALQKVKDFFEKQRKWAKNMESKHADSDPFWKHSSFVNAQLEGLYSGYKSAADNSTVKPDMFVVQLLNAVGDLLDLRTAVGESKEVDYSKMSRAELFQYIKLSGRCSALVKVTGAFENIFMAHSSWFTYSATNRIYKHYHFNLAESNTASKSLSFSSYPGFLESLDDFYILSSQMVLLQTTNNIFNKTLYKYVTPESLFAWQRVRIANSMAHSGKEWASTFKRYNSGTYNNQYMVIDLKKIKLAQEIADGALWVVEQVPSLVVGEDQTQLLRAGYWPSYNVPFYEQIYNMSGYPEFVKEHGNDYSYQMAPRAKIFRRDQGKVKDMASMQAIMRYNDYKNDPYSENQPCSAICCRGDLSTSGASPMGCYDSKVTDFSLALKFGAQAINGPTKGTNLKPFSWSSQFANRTHVGLPDTYDFGWHFMQPTL